MKFPALEVAAALALVFGASAAPGAAQPQGERKHEEGKSPPARGAAPEPHAAKPGKAHAAKAAAEKEHRDKARKNATAPKDGTAAVNGKKIHLSERQRGDVHRALLAETDLHRVVNLTIEPAVGKHLPRDIRVYALPAAVLVIVPEYRNYRYVVIGDAFCVVEPRTHRIVDIVSTAEQTAAHAQLAAAPPLTLSDAERATVLEAVDAQSESTLALGFLTPGADVPRTIELKGFPKAVLERVSKLKDYKYFSAEGRIAIVDPKRAKVQMVLEPRP